MPSTQITRAQDWQADLVSGHGVYLAFSLTRALQRAVLFESILERHGFINDFNLSNPTSRSTFTLVRYTSVSRGDVSDTGLEQAEVLLHASSASQTQLQILVNDIYMALGGRGCGRILEGVLRPTKFTGRLMHNHAYGESVLKHPAKVMPNVFFLPMLKKETWWRMHWMEQHTHFLPKFDQNGNKVSDGHVIAASAGAPFLFRRTYKNACEPSPPGAYDFLNYFECADEHVHVFREVCDALRDTRKNPEWAYVREGPLIQGRRSKTWSDLSLA